MWIRPAVAEACAKFSKFWHACWSFVLPQLGLACRKWFSSLFLLIYCTVSWEADNFRQRLQSEIQGFLLYILHSAQWVQKITFSIRIGHMSYIMWIQACRNWFSSLFLLIYCTVSWEEDNFRQDRSKFLLTYCTMSWEEENFGQGLHSEIYWNQFHLIYLIYCTVG